MFPKLQKPKNPSSFTYKSAPRIRPRLYSPYKIMNAIYNNPETNNTLFLGDYRAAMDKKLLKEKNVKTVVTVAAGLAIHHPSNIKNVVYPVWDMVNFDISKYFSKGYEAIENGLKEGSVLVHCAAGISRSASMVIAYLMKKNGMKFEEVFREVRSRRRVICPNQGFIVQLKKFDKELMKTN